MSVEEHNFGHVLVYTLHSSREVVTKGGHYGIDAGLGFHFCVSDNDIISKFKQTGLSIDNGISSLIVSKHPLRGIFVEFCILPTGVN